MAEFDPYRAPVAADAQSGDTRPASDTFAGYLSLLLLLLSVSLSAGIGLLFQSGVISFVVFFTFFMIAVMFAVRAFIVGGVSNLAPGTLSVVMIVVILFLVSDFAGWMDTL